MVALVTAQKISRIKNQIKTFNVIDQFHDISCRLPGCFSGTWTVKVTWTKSLST